MTLAPVGNAAARMSFKQRVWKITKRWLKILGILYVVVGILMYAFQTALVFPGMFGQGKDETRMRAQDGESMVQLKAGDGTALAGLFGKAELRHVPAGARDLRPVVLHFYGNAESMATSRWMGEMYRRMGYHCMLVDYEGFGMSGGKASEPGCYAAAEAAYRYVLTRADVDPKRVVVSGWSLGGGVAIDLAWRHREEGHICGLMTFSTFTSMVAMAQAKYPFLPVGLLLKHRFMSIDKVGSLNVPYLLGHGKSDEFVGYWQAEKLAGAYGRPELVTRYTSEKAGHNDFFDTDLDAVQEAIEGFLETVTR